MILLVTQAMPQMRAHAHPNLGRLVTPRHHPSLDAMDGLPWAADNDGFQGVDYDAYDAMLGRLKEAPRAVRGPERECLFVCVPDVVGDCEATADQWVRWQSAPRRRGLPIAFVAQDGCERGLVPHSWEIDALFIGGTTAWKLGPGAERLARNARRAGLWVHMGRVNSERRMRYAASIGCHSVDGTKWVRWRHKYLDPGLELAAELTEHPPCPQLRLA